MRAGRILQLGDPSDIYYRPADPFVAGFIGDTNLLPVTVTRRDASSIAYNGGEVADVSNTAPARLAAQTVQPGAALMMVRPELIRRCHDDEIVDCSIPARITEVFIKGGTVQYRAESPQGQQLAVEIQGTSQLPMQLGETVRLGWQKKDIWFLMPGAA